MQASETKLQQIIEGTKQYVVPLFQRPYSWKKSEWQMLWDDLIELSESDNPRTHFMGSIVTIPTTSIPEGVSKYLLIDGQQRLTTIFILLCAIRDRAKETKDEELVAEINNTILVNPYKKGLDYYKLQPTQIDREVFHKLIRAESEVNSSEIQECYNFFLRKIRQNITDIYKIHKIICNNLSIVSVVLSTEDDPYLVFESLNAKGRALTQADLIRNYFFMRIHSNNQESIYKQYWQPMEMLLGADLTEFIRHYLTKDTIDVKQNEIYLQIKEKIKQDDALPHLQDLHKFANYYSRLLNPDLENNLKIRKYLKRIDRLEVSTVYPFLLNCYEEWIQNKISEDEFIAIFQTLENFILRRFVCDVQTRGLNRIFALLYSQITKDPNVTSGSFVERLKIILQSKDYPKDSSFKERLLDVKLYGSNRTEKAKLILESLEESFQHKEQVDLSKVSIEHVMPQTLNNWWKEHLGEDWSITHDLFVHSLGNLTLTAYNSELSNSDFITKRSEYKKSHLELNKYFEQCDVWKRDTIETRADYLANRIVEIWSYFGDESVGTIEPNVLTGKVPKVLFMCGEEYSVKSWRDVLETTLNNIAAIEPEHFKEIMEQFPRLVGADEKGFRSTRKLKNGIFIETNLSAKYIYSLCLRSIEIAELSVQDWYVDTVKS
ncbi:DUF262 domain-containing protein [Pseudanabaena sp. 'Roaring Creek']|uniref:DUF262 domain-containing protein n=1 Tax=Pseudanabaena sp. 'Roaring Creek' TaxID=1681830 RepID=UPI0006D7B311|nr:DUF262 domain-containing protein [Pseudanabaena sp. 'Roaring Creek']